MAVIGAADDTDISTEKDNADQQPRIDKHGPTPLTGIATIDADRARCLARCQCFNVMVRRKCCLGTSQTLSDKISEHPELSAARGCPPPGQHQGPEWSVWIERPYHNIAS
jgi:hypothetical protein